MAAPNRFLVFSRGIFFFSGKKWIIRTWWGLERWIMVKSTGCSCKGPRFNSKHSHGSSQLSVTPVSWYLTSSL
ncbi:mCG1048556 [Mus musculus]|nr:mCG1048556 [Mus musculus]